MMNMSRKAARMSNSRTTKANVIQVPHPRHVRRLPRPGVVVPRDLTVDLRPVDDGDDPRDDAQKGEEQRERGEDETNQRQQNGLHEVELGMLGTEAPGPAADPAESPAPPVARGGTSTLGGCIFRNSAPQLTQYAVPSSFRVPQLEQNIGFAPPSKRSNNVGQRCPIRYAGFRPPNSTPPAAREPHEKAAPPEGRRLKSSRWGNLTSCRPCRRRAWPGSPPRARR